MISFSQSVADRAVQDGLVEVEAILGLLGPSTLLIQERSREPEQDSRLVLKLCQTQEDALYEAEMTNWVRNVTQLRTPSVKILKTGPDRSWIAMEYLGSTTVDSMLRVEGTDRKSVYEPVVDILARFHSQTAAALDKPASLPPLSVRRKWIARRRETPNDYEMRLLAATQDAESAYLNSFYRQLVGSGAVNPVVTLLAECPLRLISKDANPRNWVVAENSICLIDFSETAIDAGIRDLANLLTYYGAPSTTDPKAGLMWLETMLERYLAKLGEGHSRLDRNVRREKPFYYAACIYTTLRRIPCNIRPAHPEMSLWIDSVQIYLDALKHSLETARMYESVCGSRLARLARVWASFALEELG